MANKKIYPDTIPFRFMGFQWQIKFANITNENFGETDVDAKEINIYYKNRSRQNVIETLIHELMHVLVFDMSDAIFNFEHEKMDNREENAIRLVSPRAFHLFKDNPKLMLFIIKEIKECN